MVRVLIGTVIVAIIALVIGFWWYRVQTVFQSCVERDSPRYKAERVAANRAENSADRDSEKALRRGG